MQKETYNAATRHENVGRQSEPAQSIRRNTSFVDPRTGSVLPGVNPLALIPHQVRNGQIVQVLFKQSHDLRGDVDHRVGYSSNVQSNLNPRAYGALNDRQNLASAFQNEHVRHIPRRERIARAR